MAALDWDETCIRGDISYALLDDLDAPRPGHLWDPYREHLARDVLGAYLALARLLVEGRTDAEIAGWTRDVCARAIDTGKLAWVDEIADLVSALHDRGWAVWVVTASPTPVVAAICDHYGIDPSRVIGMHVPVGPGGRHSGEVDRPAPWGPGKLELLRARAGADPEFAAGDSWGDAPLLTAARHALWIDRGDPRLALAASTHGWWRQEGW